MLVLCEGGGGSLLESTLSLLEYYLSLQEYYLSILKQTLCFKHAQVYSEYTVSLSLLKFIQYNQLLKYIQNIL